MHRKLGTSDLASAPPSSTSGVGPDARKAAGYTLSMMHVQMSYALLCVHAAREAGTSRYAAPSVGLSATARGAYRLFMHRRQALGNNCKLESGIYDRSAARRV